MNTFNIGLHNRDITINCGQEQREEGGASSHASRMKKAGKKQTAVNLIENGILSMEKNIVWTKGQEGLRRDNVGWNVRPHKRTQDVGHVGSRIIYESYMQAKQLQLVLNQ